MASYDVEMNDIKLPAIPSANSLSVAVPEPASNLLPLRANFGHTAGSASAAPAGTRHTVLPCAGSAGGFYLAVPEPSGLLLCFIGLAAIGPAPSRARRCVAVGANI
jgi:hypothetical protein